MTAVLIIDDSITIRQRIKLELKKATLFDEYHEARDGAEGLRVVEAHPIDLVLCDVIMPGMDGFEFLAAMKAAEGSADIPVIMLTGQESTEKKIQGLDLGASDYLTKPFDPGELIARVRVQLKIKQLQDDLRNANERYRELSVTDYLTKLFNRRHFMDIFLNEFERAQRYLLPLSFVILDIDHFKSINDTKGHLVGDSVLAELAGVLRHNLRSHDVVARYGGEEFVVLLPMAGADEAVRVAEKLRSRTERYRFSAMDGRSVTISVGVCSYPRKGVDKVDQIIAAADEALYQAKRNGRNVVWMSGEDIPALRHPARANLDLIQNGSTPDVPATPEGGTGPGGLPS
jgi:two-component system, cell cycle response regulator